MTRTLLLFIAGSIVGVALLGGALAIRDGWVGVICAAVAGVICIIPTAATLAFTLWSKQRSSSEQLMAVMGGMVFRMAAVLTASLALFLTLPQMRQSRERDLQYWSAILICYMGTLAFETVLTARTRKTSLGVSPVSAASSGGGAV